MTSRRIRVLILLSFFLVNILFSVIPALVDPVSAKSVTPHGFETVLEYINQTNVIDHVKFFSNRSRFTGYPGFFEGAQYIASKFSEYGLQPYGTRNLL